MLCYSTGSLPDAFSLTDIAELLAPTPFRGVELVVTPDMLARSGDAAYWRGVQDGFTAAGLRFRNVHLGAPFLLGPEPHRPGLSSLDASQRGLKAAAARKAAAIAALLGSPHVTLTTGLPEGESGDGPEGGRQEEALRAALADLIRDKPRNVALLIEQEPEQVIRSAAQLLGLCRAFPGEVFANFDVGHSEVMGEDIPAAIFSLAPVLRNIHLEDIRGRVHAHRLFGEGEVDFAGIFRSLREIGYRGDYTPDLYPFKDDYARALASSQAFFREHGVLTRAL